MSAKTSIEWTRGDDGTSGATWNPTVGCTKVSAGCDHCYAETLVNRFAGHNAAFPERFDTVVLRPHFLDRPLRWQRPRRIFVNSLSDLFHKDVPDEFIVEVFAVMAATPRHTYQLLTKRHGRMRSLLSSEEFIAEVEFAARHRRGGPAMTPGWGPDDEMPWPLPNVWLGISAEDQATADLRIPALLNTPAAVRWVSAEPLLGPIDLEAWMPAGQARWHCRPRTGCGRFFAGDHRQNCPHCGNVDYWCGSHVGNAHPNGQPINWVVAGGESGPGARPMHPDWARGLRDQCAHAGVPYHFKQWGSHDEHGTPMAKNRTGRHLDGVLHDGYPDAAQ